eukprot:PLAT4773.1.p2 GENE.PLAT4773.1~~PLAT4773.1.p2  ORF type:complete len:444 (-),score=260.47 PLAT4773.1:175-1506(-)
MSTFEEAKAILQKSGSDGASLYDHMAEVLLRVIQERPDDALAAFEQLSAGVKKDRLAVTAEVERPLVDQSPAGSSARAATLAWADSLKPLYAREGGEDEEEESEAAVQDVVDELNMFEWAGVSFGREAAFRLFLSLRKLAADPEQDIKAIRLWGKVLGLDSDYFVAEAVLNTPDEKDEETGVEGGEGANKYTYFVCSHPGAAWSRLPAVTPAQVCAARSIRRFLTGNLDADVRAYPPFPGKERNLLRAQIARITASTVVAPEGTFIVDDDDEVVLNDEAEERAAAELLELSAWAHAELELNRIGRCTPKPAEEDADGEPIDDPDAPDEVPPLRSLEDDDEASDGWSARLAPASAKDAASAIVVLRSLRWPGAFAIGFGKRFANIYVGYATRHSDTTFTPVLPPALQVEFSDPSFGEEDDVTEDPDPPVPDEDEDAASDAGSDY